MRIKIEGEVTAERLAQALQAAMDKFPGDTQTKFYGANLYLTVFNAEGLPVEVVNARGEPIIIKMPAPAGTLARPALTAEGAELRRRAKEAEEARRAEEAERIRQEDAAFRERQRQLRAEQAAAKQAWEKVNKITAQQMGARADEFVSELNEIVKGVWAEMAPVEPTGPQKGQPKPMPVFSNDHGLLFLVTPAWKSSKQIYNPVFSSCSDRLKRFWTHAAWDEACKRMQSMMDVGESSQSSSSASGLKTEQGIPQ